MKAVLFAFAVAAPVHVFYSFVSSIARLPNHAVDTHAHAFVLWSEFTAMVGGLLKLS